ncbi:hypothetical protein AAG906_025791 [Vitis piasezkii]
MRRYKDKLLHLERWSEEAGCLRLGSSAKEVWVRVVGIRLHCWSGGKFKKIGDCCEGLLEVDEETKRFSQLQEARILLWWEVPLWVSAVVSMNKLKGSEGKRKTKGEKKGDGDGTVEIVDGFSGFGKGIGEKGGERVGLRENRGSIAFNGCRPVCLDARAQGNADLLCEGTTNLLNFGLGHALREDERCGPKSFWEAGQSSKVAVRVSDPDRVFLDEPLKKGVVCEEDLVCGKGSKEVEGDLGSFSPTDVCLIEEASRVEGALIEVEEGHDVVVILKENERELSVSPLRVLLAEGWDFEKGVGVEEEGGDVESWRYSCLAKFCHCLEMPIEGFEGEILKLLNRMKERRERFERKLECSVNYSGSRGDRGVYGPTLKLDREDFLSELGAIRRLWSEPWCVAGDFNMIRFPSA